MDMPGRNSSDDMPDLKTIETAQTGSPSAPLSADRARVFLLPGQWHASAEASQITTILGSCVAICLWDMEQAMGGMNHFLLPAWREGEGASSRFGDVATRALLEKLLKLGCKRRNITAKLFGGSALFQSDDRYLASLGAKNVAAAQRMLRNADIPIIAQDTGGSHGRKLVFHTDDGSAWSRRV